ncbi:MAG TPA: lycopene cyclase domain-containing protein, partial [Chryseosolibacter sp.]|nr:lycopene cyclase domain-containing protein [Chryseosolibacter sp.]
YLLVDLATLIVPLLFSFHPRLRFTSKWKYYLPSIFITAVIFIVWDEVFTGMGVWGFNKQYLTGVYVGKLPLEELLFFICIPYACLFTYEAFKALLPKANFPNGMAISVMMLVLSVTILIFNFTRWYTATTFLALSIVLTVDIFVLKSQGRGIFYLTYAILLIPFFIVNGILTGSFIAEPVVWYDDAENLGIRIGTIPVEDIFYGMTLILMNVMIAEVLSGKLSKSQTK